MTVPVLILSGTIGVGKSAVLNECTDILSARGEPYAAIELDALAIIDLKSRDERHALAFENLAPVWGNMTRRGARRLLIGAAVEKQEHLEQYAQAIPGADLTVCLLTASAETIERRLRSREIGSALLWHLERSRELDAILKAAETHDFSVSNDSDRVEAVASEVLRRCDWID